MTESKGWHTQQFDRLCLHEKKSFMDKVLLVFLFCIIHLLLFCYQIWRLSSIVLISLYATITFHLFPTARVNPFCTWMLRKPLDSSVLAFTQLSWELRTVYIVSLVHMDTGKFIACLGWQRVFEDCKNCALLGSLAPRRGLPACPWSVSSAGLLLESDSSNERVLGFQSGGTQPPPARLPGELSADAESAWSLEDWIALPFEGVSKFLRHNIFVATIC